MPLYYFDTDALSWRYVDSTNPALTAPSINVTDNASEIIERTENECYISEFVLLEWTSTLAKRVRAEGPALNNLDYDWLKNNERAIMKDILDCRLKVLPPILRIIERARLLVDRVGAHFRRALMTVDAVHLVYAIELAQTKSSRVKFVSCDGSLLAIVNDFPPVKRFLDPYRPY